MPLSFNSVSEARAYVGRLRNRAAALDRRIAALRAEQVAVQRLRQATLEWIAAKSVPSSGGDDRPLSAADAMRCSTQREVLREWASRNGGVVRLREAVDLLIESGKARGQRAGVRATLNNYCRDSDDWRYQSPGVYRWVGSS